MAVVLFAHCATAVVAFFLTAIDQREHRLPDAATLGLWTMGAMTTAWLALRHGLYGRAELSVVASASVVLLLWLLTELPGKPMGFGDVKLGGALAMQLGWYGSEGWWSLIVFAFLLGGAWSLFHWARGLLLPREYIAFGPFLLLGWGLTLILSADSRAMLAETI